MAEQATLQQVFDTALDALKGKQRNFVVEYLRDLHGTNAAIRAGYSKETARSQASRMLTFVNIAAAVNAGMALYAMPAPEVLYRLAQEARGSMADFLRVDEEEVTVSQVIAYVTEHEAGGIVSDAIARLKGEDEVNDGPRRALLITTETVTRAVARLDLLQAADKLHLVKKYSLDDKGKVSIELYDAQVAKQLIGKHHGLFVDRTEVTGKDGKAIDVTSTVLDQAARELGEWREQMNRQLSGLSAPPTPPMPAITTES
jgi:phage terminase small subunit